MEKCQDKEFSWKPDIVLMEEITHPSIADMWLGSIPILVDVDNQAMAVAKANRQFEMANNRHLRSSKLGKRCHPQEGGGRDDQPETS